MKSSLDRDPEGKDGKGIINVVTESLIDIEFVVRNASNIRALRSELQQYNKRFAEIYENNRRLATKLRQVQEEKRMLEEEAQILREDQEKIQNTLKKKERENRKKLKAEEKKAKEAKKISAKLMEYIEKYIYDPVIADHLVNDLKILTPDMGNEVNIPEQLRSLFHDGCSDEESMIRFARWMQDDVEEIDDYEEDYEEDDEEAEVPVVLTKAETLGMRLLDELEEE